MKYLITGGAGFIGGHLTEIFLPTDMKFSPSTIFPRALRATLKRCGTTRVSTLPKRT